MTSSQDAATAVALRGAGLRRHRAGRSPASSPGAPADGVLEVGDVILAVDGKPVDDARTSVVAEVSGRRAGASRSTFVVRRDGERTRGRGHARGRRRAAAGRHPASAPGRGRPARRRHDQHRPEHRRPERRADVLARHLRHAHPRLAHRRRDHRRHRHHRRRRQRSARSAASSRRSSVPATPGPSCSWCRRTTAQDALGAPNEDMRLVRADDHARRPGRDRGVGRRTPTPTCPAARRATRPRDRVRRRPSTSTRRWPPPSSRSRATSPPGGWDQPARLYALVDTAGLVEREPALAAAMGLDDASAQGSLTPVEQDQLAPDQPLEVALESIVWPPEVTGCAAVVERLVLPPDADERDPRRPGARPRSSPASTRTARRSGSSRA